MDFPDVAPMLSYEDVGVAADWLCAAFGFSELSRFEGSGRVTHVSLGAGDGVVMAGWPGPDYRSPKTHRQTCAEADRWLDGPFVVDGVYVRVDDIQAHFDRAREAGATILSPVQDNPPAGRVSTGRRTRRVIAGCWPSPCSRPPPPAFGP
jgi:uncharacterized glyoxalase superfamily protein PhnB